MKYSKNIAEILQRYHSNIKISAKMNHSNIMMTYSYITIILFNIYVIFM